MLLKATMSKTSQVLRCGPKERGIRGRTKGFLSVSSHHRWGPLIHVCGDGQRVEYGKSLAASKLGALDCGAMWRLVAMVAQYV